MSQERLDRFVGSSAWKDVYRAISVSNINVWGSDHSPILIDFWKRETSLFQKRQHWGRIFLFEDYWNNYRECSQIVEQVWHASHTEVNSTPISIYLQNSTAVRGRLQEWSRQKFDDRKRNRQMLTAKLTSLKSDPLQHYDKIRTVEKHIDDFLGMRKYTGGKDLKLFGLKKWTVTPNIFMLKLHVEGNEILLLAFSTTIISGHRTS